MVSVQGRAGGVRVQVERWGQNNGFCWTGRKFESLVGLRFNDNEAVAVSRFWRWRL